MKSVSFRMAFALIGTLLLPYFICDIDYLFSNSLFPFFLFPTLFFLFKSVSDKKYCKRKALFSYLNGFLFAIMTAFGFHLTKTGDIPFRSVLLWCSIFFYSYVYGLLLAYLWDYLDFFNTKALSTPPENLFAFSHGCVRDPYVLLLFFFFSGLYVF